MAEINNIIEALIDRGPKEWESEGDNPQAIMDSWKAYHEKSSEITPGLPLGVSHDDMNEIMDLVMGVTGGGGGSGKIGGTIGQFLKKGWKKGHDAINKIIKRNNENLANIRFAPQRAAKSVADKKFIDDLIERNPNMIYDKATNTFKNITNQGSTHQTYEGIIKKFPEMKAFKGEIKENLKKGYEFVGPKFTSKSDFGAHFAREYKKLERIPKNNLYKKLLPLLLGTTLIDSDTTGTE